MSESHYRKGIILAGGAGSRLYPLTVSVSKQLLPVYDKPMIYYPLSTLMLAGIRQILVVSSPEHVAGYERLLGDGGRLGLQIQYAVQPRPDGLPQAFDIGREFIAEDNVALILGDNIFFGQSFQMTLEAAAVRPEGATIFTYRVRNPQRYGVVEMDADEKPIALAEKPSSPRSNLAVTGLYFFDNEVVDIAAQVTPSARGETEIIDVITAYLERGRLFVEGLGRGFAWLDTGTHDSLLQGSNFIAAIEKRQGLKIACVEEVAYLKGFISGDQLRALAEPLDEEYRHYLLSLLDG
ncbi:MAG: glucose-1-phosphate thymidylyltransferase [Planctomycetota bacterium]|nr:MAG: glucose-1-phosphate thymidylyltransferase [Planctomycetota bacterium]